MRFDVAKLIALHHPQSGHSIGDAPLMQLLQSWNFLGAGGDHQLAAFLKSNSMVLAEALHGSRACQAVARLEGTGFVIETRMNYAAVVSGLVGGYVVFLLDYEQAHFRISSGGFESGCQPNNSGADN